MPRMNLMPKEMQERLPPLYANEGKPIAQVIIPLKLFNPAGRWTMFVTEFDGDDTLFGFTVSHFGPEEDEWGYASLGEIRQTRGALGLKMERDMYWKPCTVAELAEKLPTLKERLLV